MLVNSSGNPITAPKSHTYKTHWTAVAEVQDPGSNDSRIARVAQESVLVTEPCGLIPPDEVEAWVQNEIGPGVSQNPPPGTLAILIYYAIFETTGDLGFADMVLVKTGVLRMVANGEKGISSAG